MQLKLHHLFSRPLQEASHVSVSALFQCAVEGMQALKSRDAIGVVYTYVCSLLIS